jgi:hypothetical protein
MIWSGIFNSLNYSASKMNLKFGDKSLDQWILHSSLASHARTYSTISFLNPVTITSNLTHANPLLTQLPKLLFTLPIIHPLRIPLIRILPHPLFPLLSSRPLCSIQLLKYLPPL